MWLPGWSMIICFLFCDGCSSVKLILCGDLDDLWSYVFCFVMVVHQLNWYCVWLPGWSTTVFCFVMVVHQLNWYCVWLPGWSTTVFCFVMVVHQLNWYCVWLPGWSMIICFLFCDGCSSVKLILCVVTWMIYDCFLFCDGCSSVKLISVLQKNPPCPADSSVFQHLLHLWTLSSRDCMVLRSIFSHWGRLRDSNTTIKKV